jgi:hypothetical protein
MVPANSVTIAIAAGANDFQFVIAKFHTGRHGQGAAMKGVHSVSVDVTGQIRRTTDAADDAGLMRLQSQLEQRRLQGGEHGKIAATGTPVRMDATAVDFLGQSAGLNCACGCRWICGGAHEFVNR